MVNQLRFNDAAYTFKVFSICSPAIRIEESPSDDQSDESCRQKIRLLFAKFPFSFEQRREILKVFNSIRRIAPKDPRTLMRTPRERCQFFIGSGTYVHLGLQKALSFHLRHADFSQLEEIQVQLFVDGTSLSNSSSLQLWPILAKTIQPKIAQPFVVGMYSGTSKPKDVSMYLLKLVNDITDLYRSGFITKTNDSIPLRIVNFICDTPARAFIKQTVGHTGYFACDKCTVRGRYIRTNVAFADCNATLRTDSTFRRRNQRQHHKGVSPLTRLNCDMIACFPNDYMHSVCLGVTRKLIFAWCGKLGLKFRCLSESIKSVLSARIVQMNEHLPMDFCRKGRDLSLLDRWKASEFRLFYYTQARFYFTV